MVTKEEFNKVWKDSTKENILNQFYYEHIAIRKAIEYINKQDMAYYGSVVETKIGIILNILQNGSEENE